METLWQDLRYSIRLLIKHRGFTGVAVLALALGIGANTAIFSLVNGVLLAPLPGIQEPGALVQLERHQNGRISTNFGYPDYLNYRDRSGTMSGLAAHCATPLSFSRGQTERVSGSLVTGNYFSVLGVRAALGRLLAPSDDLTPGAHPVAVVSYALWQRAYGADPAIAGREIRLNGYNFTVVGVAEKEFRGITRGNPTDVWLPMAMLSEGMPRTREGGGSWFGERAWGWLGIFGRLKPGVPVEQARAEIRAIAGELEQTHSQTNAGRSANVVSGVGLSSGDRRELRGFLGILLAAVVLLLLIACANVANLLLVGAESRRREIAVRLALGAGRARLIRQLLTEGVLLSFTAGVLGLLLAPWTAEVIATFQQRAGLFRGASFDLDYRVLGFTLGVSLLTGVVFALAPALEISKPDLVASLKEGAPASSRRRSRLQKGLVAGQVALSLVLLIGAGLAVRTLRQTLAEDRGFASEGLVLASLDLSIQGYSEEQGLAFYDRLIRRLENAPGIDSASLAKTVPPNSWSDRMAVFHEGQEPPQELLRGGEELGLKVEMNRIAPRYFKTLGITIVQGREFSSQDRAGAPPVAIINERLARKLWPGEDPLGKRLAAPFLSGPPRPPVEIVGVAGDTRHRSLLEEPPFILYLPVLQAYDGRATLVARATGGTASAVAAVRGEVAAIDLDLPLFAVKSMSEQIAGTLEQQRMAAGLIGIFGLLALALAAVGLYGVIAHTVAQQTHEIGIRMALGAEARDVLKMVIKQGLALALAGVAGGLLAAFALSKVMLRMLYGVSATDPLTFVAVSMALMAVALAATYLPARKATRVDPITALRRE